MEQLPVIFDCDPGVDDAFAVFYILKEALVDLRLITSVSGNVSVDKTTLNIRRLITMAKQEVPIAQGAARPLKAEPLYADHIHGQNGMGDYDLEGVKPAALLETGAIETMRDVIMNSKKPLNLIAVGPLTNIALLLNTYPEVKANIAVISFMGGGLKGGNTTMAAEFNIYVDPEAAKIVFESGVPLIMSGLDVTEQAYIESEDLSVLESCGEIGSFLSDVIQRARKSAQGFKSALHDVVAIAALTRPDLFISEKYHVEVETQGSLTRGMTVADRRLNGRKEGNVTVMLGLDREAFLETLYHNLRSYQ